MHFSVQNEIFLLIFSGVLWLVKDAFYHVMEFVDDFLAGYRILDELLSVYRKKNCNNFLPKETRISSQSVGTHTRMQETHIFYGRKTSNKYTANIVDDCCGILALCCTNLREWSL